MTSDIADPEYAEISELRLKKSKTSAAWELFQQHRGEGLPVSGVVYSHNPGDHWGGVRAILTDEDVVSGRVPVIAPAGFTENAISKNVFAGNAMNRRLFYQYGILLPINPFGYVTQGLGLRVSAGSTGLSMAALSASRARSLFCCRLC